MNRNEAQERAIRTINGQMIIIACPGSGKTTTLLRRIQYMVTEGGIKPEHILMITFTNAAAKEMRTRYVNNYGNNLKITFCTIHSLCLAILRKFSGLNSSNIIQEYEIKKFFYDRLIKNRQIRDKEDFIKMLMTDISVVKNNRYDLNTYRQKCCDDFAMFHQLYQDYESFKKSIGKIDFDDMLLLAYEKMQNDKNCINWLRNRYRYIQVDEYQDVNFLQRDIIYLLAGENPNLVVVGDDDQSIYGFRGARPEVMLNFPKDFPKAEVIQMSINYRSERKIIDKAGELIKKNIKRFAKEFRGFKEEQGFIERYIASDRANEVEQVMRTIESELSEGADPNNYAILYRSNKQSIEFADYCVEHKIPFVCSERIQNKYKHWIFRDIQLFLKTSLGKCTRQELEQVMNKPQRYLNHPDYFMNGCDKNWMLNMVNKHITDDWRREKATDGIMDFFYVLEYFRYNPPLEALQIMFGIGAYQKYLKSYADYRNLEVEEFYNIWDSYLADIKKCGNDWNKWFFYIENYEKELEKTKENAKGITLSTMHRSKGLEWDTVFLVDCVDGITPFAKAETPDDFEEERRIFYVGITRAKKKLYLYSYSKNHAKKVEISPYLEEMDCFGDYEKHNKGLSKTKRGKTSPIKFVPGDMVLHRDFGKGTVVHSDNRKYIVLFHATKESITFDRRWIENRNMFQRIAYAE